MEPSQTQPVRYEPINCPLCRKFMGEWHVVGEASFLKKCRRCGKMVIVKKNTCIIPDVVLAKNKYTT